MKDDIVLIKELAEYLKIFVINEKEINNIPINENNEPLIDLKEQNELAYGPPPDTPLTMNDYTKIRKTIYEKLCQAQNKLPNGWKFRIYEGLRSLNEAFYGGITITAPHEITNGIELTLP